MKNTWLGVGFVVALVTVAGIFFFIGRQQGVIETLHTPSPTPQAVVEVLSPTVPLQQPTKSILQATPTQTPSPTQSARSRQDLKEQLMAIIQSKNYAALSGYMIEKPLVRLENSGCCGYISQTEAISQMEYLNSATGTWDFDEGNPSIAALKSANPEYYGGDAIVGVSSDKFAVAFQIDATNTVTAISMTGSYDLLLP